MQDLTKGPLTRHLLSMAGFIGVSLVFQTLYFMIDLYFVSRLGGAAIAGVSSAGNVFFVALAAAQLIGVGGLALISQATGRKDQADANLVFNQSMSFSLVLALATLALGYALAGPITRALGADAATAAAGHAYLLAFLPSLAMMFPTTALSIALRAAGVVRPTMLVQTGAVLLNALLAPILIAGWLTGRPLGVAGAGLASTIAGTLGAVILFLIFPRVQGFLRTEMADWRPRLDVWKRITAIGLPAAGEFFLMFLISSLTYWVIRGFGADAQAGFGVGYRVMQAIFLPAMAVAFAAAPIAGQNFGAGRFDRLRGTFVRSALIGSAIMLTLTLLCHISPEWLVAPFTTDPSVIEPAVTYLKIGSWNFVAIGLVFACSGMFQALGDTRPSFLSSASRLITFAIPAVWLSSLPGAKLEWVWYASVASIALQALFSLWLLRGVFRRKLAGA